MFKDGQPLIRLFMTVLVAFGVFQLAILFQVYHNSSFQVTNQCECDCPSQLQMGQTDPEPLKCNGSCSGQRSFGEKLADEVEDGDDYTDTIEQSRILADIKLLDPATYSPMELNPAIDHTRVRCTKGNYSNVFIIYVYTAPGHYKERQTIRETWGSVKRFDGVEFRTIFFIGRLANDSTGEEYRHLKKESGKHGDIVQDLSYIDSYRNLTLKGISALQWINTYCPYPYRILKVDDDTLVNPYQLVKYLRKQEPGALEAFICKVTSGSEPIRNESHKFYLSNKQFSRKFFPDYCQGCGYSFPPSMVPKILNGIKKTRIIAMEDVYFSGMLREAAGLKIKALQLTNYAIHTRKTGFERFLEITIRRKNLFLYGHVHDFRDKEIFWRIIDPRK